jgi:hypothetical protein
MPIEAAIARLPGFNNRWARYSCVDRGSIAEDIIVIVRRFFDGAPFSYSKLTVIFEGLWKGNRQEAGGIR